MNYRVAILCGSGDIEIFYNNEKLIKETENVDGNFREIGTTGQASNKVVFGWDVEVGSILEIRVKGGIADEESN